MIGKGPEMAEMSANQISSVIQEFDRISREILSVLYMRVEMARQGESQPLTAGEVAIRRETLNRLNELLQPFLEGVDLDVSLQLLGIPETVLSPLRGRRIVSVREALEAGPERIIYIRSMGPKRFQVLEKALQEYCKTEDPWSFLG